MNTFLALVCLLTGVALTLGTIGLAVRRGVRQLAVAAAYREVAHQIGLQVDTRGVSVRGHLGERRIWIGEVMEGHGTERRREVRGVIGLERPLGLGLQIRRRGRTDRLLRRGRRAPERTIGDPILDQLLHVHGDDAERTRALFVPAVRDALRLLMTKAWDLVVLDDEIQVWLNAPAEAADELGALVDAMVKTAEAIEAARRDIPPPVALEPLADAWKPLAAARGLDVDAWLPSMHGVVGTHRVAVTARREGEGYAAVVQVWFAPHPELGLLLRPQVEPDGYWSVGQDIQVGDRAFDSAFVIKGWDPYAVTARLSAEARKRLLKLRERGGHLVVDDRGLVLRGVPLDPGQLGPIVDEAVGAADALGW